MKKRVKYFAVMTAMVTALAGCGSGNGGSTDGDAAQGGKTAEEYIQYAVEQSEGIESMDVITDMLVTMRMGEESVEMVTRSEMSAFVDPYKSKAEVSTYMKGAEEQAIDMEVYMQEEEGTMHSYIYSEAVGGWMHEAMDMEEAGVYFEGNTMSIYLEGMQNVSITEEKEENGITIARIDGVLTGEEMEIMIEESGILSSSMTMGMSEDDIRALYQELGDLPLAMWVGDDGMVYGYEMDMKDLMQAIMNNAMSMMGGASEDGANQITIDVATVTMECSNYNNVADFSVPEEALAA